MKILLIGGNRYVGVEIIWHLLRAGHDVTVLALDSPPADVRPHVRLLIANRNNKDTLSSVLAHEKFDVVIDNIAYEPHQVVSLTDVLKGKVERYILTSTTDAYPSNFPRCYAEDQADIREFEPTELSASGRYGKGKRSCEAVLMKSGIPWTVIRPCQVTGPRDNMNGAPALRNIHWFEECARSHFWVQRLLDAGPLLMTRVDEAVSKMVWVGDLARAFTHVIAHPETTVGQAFNVTGDEIWTNERFVRALASAASITPEIVYVPHAVLEQAGLDYSPVYGTSPFWTLADNAKLKLTGWKPTPAEQWLPFLMETNSKPTSRTWYHTRIQEIALARHLQRKQNNKASFPAAIEQWPSSPAPTLPLSYATVAGHLEAEASYAWQQRTMEQTSSNVPAPTFFKTFRNATVSGIGVGTWMGDLTAATDTKYIETLVHAASRGINVFDTAINYRHMKAERCVGSAIQRLVKSGIPREALLVATKGGYITHDAAGSRNWADYVRQEYLETGLISAEDMKRKRAINPLFIHHQIEQSLTNLNLESVDIYYLHNPEEDIATLGSETFRKILTNTFAVFEQAVADGKIGCYGLATWQGLRVPPNDPRHLSLELAEASARDAAGGKHHLAVLQLPFNFKDNQALVLPTQKVGNNFLTAFQAAEEFGLYVMTSSSVLQGKAIPKEDESRLRAVAPGHSLSTAALQISRSIPGVGTALVGMRRIQSVEDSLSVASIPICHEVTYGYWIPRAILSINDFKLL